MTQDGAVYASQEAAGRPRPAGKAVVQAFTQARMDTGCAHFPEKSPAQGGIQGAFRDPENRTNSPKMTAKQDRNDKETSTRADGARPPDPPADWPSPALEQDRAAGLGAFSIQRRRTK